MEIVGIIPARSGSKGIPGKNIREIAGKPLIAWTIQAARRSNALKRIIVTTDDEKIANVAREWEAEAPFIRPRELATDTTSQYSVVEHALQWLKEEDNFSPEYCLLLQPTSPLRMSQDILDSIEMARTRNVNAVVSVCEAHPHPYLFKRISGNGVLEDFIPLSSSYVRRQDFPPAYALNGAIYINRTDSLLTGKSFVPKDTIAYIMPKERSIDIDTPFDFQIAEFLLKTANY